MMREGEYQKHCPVNKVTGEHDWIKSDQEGMIHCLNCQVTVSKEKQIETEIKTGGVDLNILRKSWYGKTFILLEIAKCCYQRELAFITNKTIKDKVVIRCCKAYTMEYLQKNMERFDILKENFDAFTSVATFHTFPMFSFNFVERKKEMGDFFNNGGFERGWQGFDFVLDIDNEDLNIAYEDAKKTKKILDKFNVPYSLRFSGNRGFHFVVEDKKIFPENMPNETKVVLSRIIAENLKGINNIQSIDTTIYDSRRLLKLPYTLVNENVCLPLSDKEFENWKILDMHWSKVLQKFQLKNRGLLTRDRIINYEGLIDTYSGVYEKP